MRYDEMAACRRVTAHPAYVARQAIIVGAGIAGVAAAGALSSYFEHVVVLERDSLSTVCAPRPGASQGWHAHGLLVGGQASLAEIYPGIGDDFFRAGAVPLHMNRDMCEERPDLGAMPQRDFGMSGYTMTRPLIESTLRRRALLQPNVAIRQNMTLDADNGRPRHQSPTCGMARAPPVPPEARH